MALLPDDQKVNGNLKRMILTLLDYKGNWLKSSNMKLGSSPKSFLYKVRSFNGVLLKKANTEKGMREMFNGNHFWFIVKKLGNAGKDIFCMQYPIFLL